MPLGTYEQLQEAVLGWLGRPGDALLAPHIPDMIALFEVEANRRIRSLYNEYVAGLPMYAGYGVVQMPTDYLQLRGVRIGNRALEYVTLDQGAEMLPDGGTPRYYTISQGGEPSAKIQQMHLYPTPNGDGEVRIRYWQAIPFVGSTGSNWLLARYPDCYLFGTLAESAAFIDEDERLPLWLRRRDAAIEGINRDGVKAMQGASLQIVPDFTMPSSGGGGGGPIGAAGAPSIPPTAAASLRVVSPISGEVVAMTGTDRELFVSSAALAVLTIRLPPAASMGVGDSVEISFAAPVAALFVQDSTGMPVADAPDSAYGPGAAIVMRWLGAAEGWVYWK
jgi:hypothetical protein